MDLKTEPEKVVVKRCPLSGISCAECGYKSVLDRADCFIVELINALQGGPLEG